MNQRGDDQCGHAGGGRKNADEYYHDRAAALRPCLLRPVVRSNDDDGFDGLAKSAL